MKIWHGTATFLRGLSTLRLRVGFSWHWHLGPFIHWEPEMHFHSAGVGVGPLWFGLWDADNKEGT